MDKVIQEIAAERRRQIEVEGWTAEHDDTHVKGEMALAAARYAATTALTDQERESGAHAGVPWLWDASWWKPKTRRRDLIRAAALIVAEIERLDRKDAATGKETE